MSGKKHEKKEVSNTTTEIKSDKPRSKKRQIIDKVIMIVVIVVICVQVFKGHFYDDAEVIEAGDVSYSLLTMDSSEVTTDVLETWYFDYVETHDYAWNVILYEDQDLTGVYAVDGLVRADVHFEEESEGVYTLLWSDDDILYTPGDDENLVEVEVTVSSQESSLSGSGNTYDSVTYTMSNALSEALVEVSGYPYSYKELLECLKEDYGYAEEDATYAADNCGVDWDEQALLQAEDYMDYMDFSYTEMVEWLQTYDGFTEKEAIYAADNCGVE